MGSHYDSLIHHDEALRYRQTGDSRSDALLLAYDSVAQRQADGIEAARSAFAELTEKAVAEQTIAKMGQVAVEIG